MAILVQQGRSIAFANWSFLTQAERNSSMTEKERLAVAWSLEQFHPYRHWCQLQRLLRPRCLISVLTTKATRVRIARWIMTLLAYTLSV
jgi:hypothetical protein